MTSAPAHRTYGRDMSEDDLLQAVLDLCRLYGLRTAHFRPARTDAGWRTAGAGDGRGFLDLIILGNKLIARELKSARGRVIEPQSTWLRAMNRAGVDAGVWRPSHWLDGTIREQLKALRTARTTDQQEAIPDA